MKGKEHEIIDNIAKNKLEKASNFHPDCKVASIYATKDAMLKYSRNVLLRLEEEIESLYGDAMAPPQSGEAGYNKALDKVLEKISKKL